MKAYIYISGAFTTVNRSKCGSNGWLDNDPHFWSSPPTWGICRTDLRCRVEKGDYVFFVLPKASRLPQMIYGHFLVSEHITHPAAHHRPDLVGKRMGNKIPNGNIIVTADGRYNPLDGSDSHKRRFNSIKEHYVIGDARSSEFLNEEKICRLAPGFLPKLNAVFGTSGRSVFDVIQRGGRRLDEGQIWQLLRWLRT